MTPPTLTSLPDVLTFTEVVKGAAIAAAGAMQPQRIRVLMIGFTGAPWVVW
jgi:hypothetical protein